MSLVLSERIGRVGLVTLNRPEAKNALNEALVLELSRIVCALDEDPEIGAIVVTGGESCFSVGADIKEMTEKTFAEAYVRNFVSRDWEVLSYCRKPVIAAVAGYAIGGGCEFALMSDIVVADASARFGQPEVSVGTIPGGGGTQRLARSIGKAKAMELCLTGRLLGADEAERIGIVSILVPAGDHIRTALEMAARIAGYSLPIVEMIKESVNAAFDTGLSGGLRFERRLLHATFALDDQKEAMRAFADRRKPVFLHR
ncbi:enoyl-CoA hydratase-related protein [Cupriavidus malaysiensis]|uniref:Enoyl-CoA hydratase n=1 Tax=Cupriavidus malaysiensis TaxID=367825 RepID=A0ABM6FBX0_9BURK|nr:enoyl-CoA hydratase-related protein [Cupriavidus malaysiensis]AOZ09188.1 enoyl-CoA hydratase [Cupriavidus malaysiensis]